MRVCVKDAADKSAFVRCVYCVLRRHLATVTTVYAHTTLPAMSTLDDLRRIALALWGVSESSDAPLRFVFSVLRKGKQRGIAWAWMERVHPKKARVPNPDVVVIPVADLYEKALLLNANTGRYFTEPHYDGYAAIHMRLSDIGVDELRGLVHNAWACNAPADAVAQFKQGRGGAVLQKEGLGYSRRMAKTDFKTVDEYISTFPADKQAVLAKVRATLRKAVPDGEEVISYQIPALNYHGWVFYYSMYQAHFSLSCPPPYAFFDAFKDELAGYVKSKSTIQIPLDKPIPVKLIAAMAKFRANENKERELTKTKPPAKKSSKPAAKKPAARKG
jgi:uncharacterized protein YdhG (YjbR/CyaY superfamily)